MNLRATLSKVGRSRWLPVVILLVVGIGITMAIAHPAFAEPDGLPPIGMTKAQEEAAITGGTNIGGKIAEIIGHLLMMLVSNFGKLLAVLIDIMVQIAAFNNFTRASAVQEGWEVARDLCNLLMVIVLLLIAWGTVLRVESYHYRRMLPKFILMAILVNFSKSIAGFLIDISQVIMMSFVNVIEGEVREKLTTGVGLETILNFKDGLGSANFGEIVGALLLALILISLMFGAVIMLIFILLGRIIALWILVVLSPVAYLGETIGILKKAATTWWKMFGDYLVVGPLVAFFLWMAMLVIGSDPSSAGRQLAPGGAGSQRVVEAPASTNTDVGKFTATVSRISSSDNLLSFIVAVGMLFAASMAAQQFKTLGGTAGIAAYQGAVGASRWMATAPAGKFNRWQGSKFTGVDLNPARNVRRVIEGFSAGKKREEANVALTAEKRAGRGGLWGLMATAAPSWESQYVGAGLKTAGIRMWQGSTGPGELVRRGRDKKFDTNRKKQIAQKQMEIRELEEQQKVIARSPDPLNQGRVLQVGIDEKKNEIKKLQEASRAPTSSEVRYRPNDRAYQRLLQSKVAEAAKNLPNTAEELEEHRDAAVAMGKSGAVEAMAANEKLMQLGRGDLIQGKSTDIVAAIEALGAKLGMSKTDALYHAGNVAAIGASKGKAEYMDLITFKNGQPERQDKDKHSKTVTDALTKNPSRGYATGETSGMTSNEPGDPKNPTSPMMPVLNEAGIASLLNGGIAPLAKAIKDNKLSPKFSFLGNEKNISILEKIEKLLEGQKRGDEAIAMGRIIAHAKTIPSKPGVSRTEEALASAKNIKGSMPSNT